MVQGWVSTLEKEIIHNETKDIINNDTTLAKIESLIDKKNNYIMKLENKLIQIKMDYNLDDSIIDIEDLINDNL